MSVSLEAEQATVFHRKGSYSDSCEYIRMEVLLKYSRYGFRFGIFARLWY